MPATIDNFRRGPERPDHIKHETSCKKHGSADLSMVILDIS